MSTTSPRIVSVEFTTDPFWDNIGVAGSQYLVKARFDDGSQEVVFQFYPDEISFTDDELVGLTAVEARDLFRDKDIAYLRSDSPIWQAFHGGPDESRS